METARSNRSTRHCLSWLATFGGLFGLYLLFASTLSKVELIAGLSAAAVATVAAGLLGTVGTAQFRPTVINFFQAWRIPWYILRGSWDLLTALAAQLFTAHGAQSVIRAVPFDVGGNDARSAGRRTLAVLYTTATPNFVVLGLVPSQQLLLYHQVAPGEVPTMMQKLGSNAMSAVWLWAAVGMVTCLVPCAVTCFRGPAEDRLVGLEMGGVIVALAMVLIVQGFERPAFYDLALAVAILCFGGGMVFARFLERWL